MSQSSFDIFAIQNEKSTEHQSEAYVENEMSKLYHDFYGAAKKLDLHIMRGKSSEGVPYNDRTANMKDYYPIVCKDFDIRDLDRHTIETLCVGICTDGQSMKGDLSVIVCDYLDDNDRNSGLMLKICKHIMHEALKGKSIEMHDVRGICRRMEREYYRSH